MDSISWTSKLRQKLTGPAGWLIAGLVALVGFSVISLANPAPASANVGTGACLQVPDDFSDTASNEECEEGASEGLEAVIETALNVLTWITGIAAVFVLVIAGFRYVVSGGSSSGVTGAKNMIIYALIGIVIALLAQVIVHFVIGNVEEPIQKARTTCIITQEQFDAGKTCPIPGEQPEGTIPNCGDNTAGSVCKYIKDEGPIPDETATPGS